jgi:hypothetical protein
MRYFEHNGYFVTLDYNHSGCIATARSDDDWFKINFQGYSDRQIKGRVKTQCDYRSINNIKEGV